jgi:hypothetical protein
MARYREPDCVAPDPERGGRPCGTTMKLIGERHPAFGPNARPGHFVFQCPRCDAVRALSADTLDRYVTRTR